MPLAVFGLVIALGTSRRCSIPIYAKRLLLILPAMLQPHIKSGKIASCSSMIWKNSLRASILLLNLLLLPACYADIAPDPLSGGINMITKKNTQIEMVGEVVNIYISKSGFHTTAEFSLHNSGKPRYQTKPKNFQASIANVPVTTVKEGHTRTMSQDFTK
jgi:hypothetical protein